MSRRLTLLLVGAAVAVLMVVAMAGTALAAPGRPTVVDSYPKNRDNSVQAIDQIWVDFSEPMRRASINENTFRLYEGRFSYEELNGGCQDSCDGGTLGPPVPRCVTYFKDSRSDIWSAISDYYPDPAYFDDSSCSGTSLQVPTAYTAVVEGATDGDGWAVKDRDGRKLARDYIIHFTTCDPFDSTDDIPCRPGAFRKAR
jgi:hypothetical protein